MKVSLQNLCAQRELFLTQYADIEKSIQTLRELYKDNNEKLEIIESFDKYMKQKYEVFADLQDMENKRQKIDELDRQIHYAVCAILQNIKKESQTKKDTLEMTIRYLRELQIRYDTQEFIESLKGVGKYVGKHLSLLIWIPIVVGALTLMVYFAFNAQYLPTISKDSVLYYAFATTILGIFIAFVLSMFFLYPIYAIYKIFYDSPSQKTYPIIFFAILVVLPTIGLFIIALFDMQPSLGVFIIVLSVLVLYVWLIRLCLKQLDCFNPEKMMMSFALSFILILCYLVIMTWWMVWVGFDNLIHFIFVSIAIIFCSVFFVVLLASIRFNLVKCLFWGSVLLLVATLFLSGSLIVSKFHIGNYTAKKLVFTQEAIESVAMCQPTQGANNTLAIADVKVISSLGEYILFECSSTGGRQKVPMRFLVGETLHSSVDKEWIQ